MVIFKFFEHASIDETVSLGILDTFFDEKFQKKLFYTIRKTFQKSIALAHLFFRTIFIQEGNKD